MRRFAAALACMLMLAAAPAKADCQTTLDYYDEACEKSTNKSPGISPEEDANWQECIRRSMAEKGFTEEVEYGFFGTIAEGDLDVVCWR